MNNSWLNKIPVFPFVALGIACLFFARFTDNFFTYDDFRYIENNFQSLRQLIIGYYTLRVVSNCIWAPLYSLFAFNPVGYNLFNIALYVLNATLLFYFVQNLFKNRNLAFFAGLFFVASGVGVDVVLWKCANNSLLSLCFYLLTLITYVRAVEDGSKRYLLLSLGCYCFAMFSKEDAASLPAMLLLMELLVFPGEKVKKAIILRVLPFCTIVGVYLLLNKIVFSLLSLPPELARFYEPRPLYSLAGGLSAFFLSPTGILRDINPLAYFAAIAVVASLVLVKDRKLLVFALCWITITFLPQSLTSMGKFEPRYIFHSISRYLYIVSIGPALVYAALLINLKERLNGKVFLLVALTVFAIYGWINYENVQSRGREWQKEAAPIEAFLTAMGRVKASFPPDSFIYVENPPTGRAYMQQALRAYYRHPSIFWIVDPITYQRKPGESAFLIIVDWGQAGINGIQISAPWP